MAPECPEHKTKGAATGLAHLSDQAPEACSECTLGARLSDQSSALHNFLSGSNPFSPKNPNFDPLTSKFVPKGCLQFYVHKKGFQKHIKLEIKYHSNIIHQFNPFLQQQLNSHHKSVFMNIQGMNHQQQHLITTTTSIKHVFINNPSTTILFLINFEQNTSISIYTSKACKFNNNNSIIIKFAYLNIASKFKHEFHQLNSQ